jgi:hypothetical protein
VDFLFYFAPHHLLTSNHRCHAGKAVVMTRARGERRKFGSDIQQSTRVKSAYRDRARLG